MKDKKDLARWFEKDDHRDEYLRLLERSQHFQIGKSDQMLLEVMTRYAITRQKLGWARGSLYEVRDQIEGHNRHYIDEILEYTKDRQK